MDQITQQRTTTINQLQGKTYFGPRSPHLTRPTGWYRRWTRKHLERLLCEEEGRRKKKGKLWNGQNKTTRTTTINNWQFKTYCFSRTSHLKRPSCWCRRWTRKHNKRLLYYLREGRRKVRCEMDQIKQQKTTTISTIGKEWPTAAHVCHTWHDPVADVGVEQRSTVKGCCVRKKETEG